MRFSLDNNCLIAVAKREPEADAILQIVEAHRRGVVDVAVLGISASERQRGGGYIDNLKHFQGYLAEIGLDGLAVAQPVAWWGITFWGWSRFAADGELDRMKLIHAAMFASPFDWPTVADQARVDLNSKTTQTYRNWRNRHCDVQGLNAHVQDGRDVFVTSDRHFLDRREELAALGAQRIETPEAAAALVDGL